MPTSVCISLHNTDPLLNGADKNEEKKKVNRYNVHPLETIFDLGLDQKPIHIYNLPL